MIDWDAPAAAPDFTPPQNTVAISSMSEALALLDQWIEAYRELSRELARTHLALDRAQFLADYYKELFRHIDPFLPEFLQDKERKMAEPKVYEAIAEFLREG